jgi:hypothetical protein
LAASDNLDAMAPPKMDADLQFKLHRLAGVESAECLQHGQSVMDFDGDYLNA